MQYTYILGSKWQAEIKLCETAVAAINQLDPTPKFVMIGGDIVDALPGKNMYLYCNPIHKKLTILKWPIANVRA